MQVLSFIYYVACSSHLKHNIEVSWIVCASSLGPGGLFRSEGVCACVLCLRVRVCVCVCARVRVCASSLARPWGASP